MRMCYILIIMMMRRLEKSFGENDPWSASGKLCRGGDTTSHINIIIIIIIIININGIACGVIDDGGVVGDNLVNLVMMDLELLTMVLSSMMVVLMTLLVLVTLVNLVTMVVLQTTKAISDVEC